MERKDIRNAVLSHLAAQGTKYVPAGVSARHVHLSQADLDCLFGPGHSLHPCKALSQPGQFAAAEKVAVAGPRGELASVRVLGPVRGRSQVELTFSEAKKLGIPGQVRMSGDVDNTPGCTRQACAYAGAYEEFKRMNAAVIGISKDSAASHKKFAEKHGLPFILLSDPELTAIQGYGVWQEKKNYGKVSMGVVRSTFVISEDGVIERVMPKVKPDTNAAEVLAYLKGKNKREKGSRKLWGALFASIGF